MASPALERGYSGSEACKIVGITYRQLDYWDRTGLVKPSLKKARGYGSRRLYSYNDLVRLRAVKRLLEAGLSLPNIRKAVAFLEQHMGSNLEDANLVIHGQSAILVRNDGELVDLVRGGQGVLNILPLATVVRDVEVALKALRNPLKKTLVMAPENVGRLI